MTNPVPDMIRQHMIACEMVMESALAEERKTSQSPEEIKIIKDLLGKNSKFLQDKNLSEELQIQLNSYDRILRPLIEYNYARPRP
jgi:transcription initiation factor IIE alpha subunit